MGGVIKFKNCSLRISESQHNGIMAPPAFFSSMWQDCQALHISMQSIQTETMAQIIKNLTKPPKSCLQREIKTPQKTSSKEASSWVVARRDSSWIL
jgi:hypothetical protein